MTLDHVAIWTDQLEILKNYYVRYFDGKSNQKYMNPKTGLETYFITFASGTKLELMCLPVLAENKNDATIPYRSITHLAFGMETMQDIDEKLRQLETDNFRILRGPRKTGDGYYEFETLDPDGNRIEVMSKFR